VLPIYPKYSESLTREIKSPLIVRRNTLDSIPPNLLVKNTVIASTIEQRQTPRNPVLRIAAIVAEPGAAPRYCLVIDKSAGGVRIRTTPDFQAPNQFVLRLADGDARYNVVWRNGPIVGAELRCT
jgi:PilZ domain